MLRRLLCGLALVVVVGCGGNDDPGVPSATIAPADTPETTTTTEVMTPEEEVEAAYLKSWEVYAEAVRELDDSRLAEVYDAAALDVRRREISDYRSANTPVKVDVDHDYSIDVFQADRALVVDRYFNRSVFIDPDTEEPTEPVPNKVVNRQYELRRVEGTWKVVDVTSF